MSGQAAIRGFTYQTIASVIKSLTEDDWDFVTVEPSTANDKVDILWEGHDKRLKCQQVKSSINNFSRPDIISWLEKMIIDVPQAEKFELILIGNVDNATNKFINEFNGNNITEATSSLVDARRDKIKIDLIVFRLDFLESKVRDEISKFISNAGYHLPYLTIELIAGGLVYQFFQFSILGTRVSRIDFSEHILNWVKFNYGKDLGIETKRSKFNLYIYDKSARKFENRYSPERKLIDYLPLCSGFLGKVHDAYDKAKMMKLPPRDEPLQIHDGSQITEAYMKSILSIIGTTSVNNLSNADVPDYQKEVIRTGVKNHLNIDLSEDFFNVGNLKQDLMRVAFPMAGNGYSGSKEEIAKRETISTIYWELKTVEELRKMVRFINDQKFICLVVENAGSSFDEEITVNLLFPDGVTVITPSSFYIPEDTDAIEQLIDIRFVGKLLGIEADSLIAEYAFGPFIDVDELGHLELLYKMHGGAQQLELKKDKFMHRLQRYMDFEVYSDRPGFTQLRFAFQQINPSIKMAFPSFLLFKAEKNFVIDYQISTKHSSVIHSGKLYFDMSLPTKDFVN